MTTVDVDLQEWQRLPADRGSPLAQRTFGSDEAARQLAAQLTETGRMEVLELARGIELRATSFVGRFELAGITITVRPKISGAPLLNLLRYAYGLRHLHLFAGVDYTSTKGGFQDLLIHQLCVEARELLARGIHRDYERTSAYLTTPRGRIDFHRYFQMQSRVQAVLPCVHHPRLEDTLLNQVLLGGLTLAASVTTDSGLRTTLHRLMKMVSAEVSARRVDSIAVKNGWRAMDRRTSAYAPALTLIELLVGAEGIGLDSTERVRLPGFLFDMNRFFQALLSRFLRENLQGCEVQDEYRLKGMLTYDPGRNPRRRRTPTPRPDFVVIRDHKIAAVLDAKYRDLWAQPIPREMTYQLAVYALGAGGVGRHAAILYPTLDGAASEQAISIHEPRRGAVQAEVLLRPVNLLTLESLLQGRNSRTARERLADFAHRLAFGSQLRPARQQAPGLLAS